MNAGDGFWSACLDSVESLSMMDVRSVLAYSLMDVMGDDGDDDDMKEQIHKMNEKKSSKKKKRKSKKKSTTSSHQSQPQHSNGAKDKEQKIDDPENHDHKNSDKDSNDSPLSSSKRTTLGDDDDDDNPKDKVNHNLQGKPNPHFASMPQREKKEPASNDQKHAPPESLKKEEKKAEEGLTGIAKEILRESEYYAVLGIHKGATAKEITRAYRRRAVITHPDKIPNGDRRAFDKVSEAYEVLNDEDKKAIYDRFGKAGLEDGAMGGMGGMAGGSFQDEILRSFFGGQNPFGSSSSPSSSQHAKNPFKPRNKDSKYQLEVTLEDLYNGVHKTVIVSMRGSQQGRGMMDRNPRQSDRKTVEVSIPRGTASGQTITLPGEVDYIPDSAPADIMFLLAQRKHPIFTRKGNDLAIEMKLSFKEAICGFEKEIIHLDGRRLNIRGPTIKRHNHHQNNGSLTQLKVDDDANSSDASEPPILIKTGDVHVLKGEGMPRRNPLSTNQNVDIDVNPDDVRCKEYGDLYVQYKVEVPSSFKGALENNLTSEERDTLGILLDKLEGKKGHKKQRGKPSSSSSLKMLQVASASDFGRASGSFEVDEDDEEHLHHDDRRRSSHQSRFQYFSSPFGEAGPGNHRSFGFSNFHGQNYDNDDDGNVQCQQM
mmetsp:Transcript_12978/g.18535  ORF Transcript_12978/g.18535 Transcript_12978/m.18535 type:complete len:653 (+) Transcript_12978:775-2733(+)